jgi:hypothetical protein
VAQILRLLEEPTIYFARDRDWQQWYRALDLVHGEPPPVEETIGDLAERELTVLGAPQLAIERIELESAPKSHHILGVLSRPVTFEPGDFRG